MYQMGTKLLIILFTGILLVTACTSELPAPGNGQEAQEKVPVSVELSMNDRLKTKATDWDYDRFFPATTLEEEKKVSNVFLVIFKSIVLEDYYYGAGEFEQKDDSSIILGNTDNNSTETQEDQEDRLELEPGPHYFYAILNIPADLLERLTSFMDGQEKILTKDEFEKTITSISLDYMTRRDAGFIMTNADPPEMKTIYSDDQIKENTSLSNEITFEIGRAVGKISFAYVADEVPTGELHGSLSDIRYRIMNNPAQMYLMPVMENNILLTPHYNNTSYPADYFTPLDQR